MEDLERLTTQIEPADLWTSAGGAATIGFQIRHMAGSLDRLLTYARGEPLSDAQRAALATEKEQTPDVLVDELLRHFREAVKRGLEQLRSTPADRLDEHRAYWPRLKSV